MLFLTPSALLPSQPELLRQAQQSYVFGAITSGRVRPAVYPYDALGAYLLAAYLIIPPTKSRLVHYLRYPVFAIILLHSLDCFLHTRSPLISLAYVLGLTHVLIALQAFHLIIFNDARTEYRRIEGTATQPNAPSNFNSDTLPPRSESKSVAPRANGIRNRTGASSTSSDAVSSSVGHETATSQTYHWQYLPPTFLHRLEWAIDLIITFRAPRWHHQVPALTSPPAHIARQVSLDPRPSPNAAFAEMTRADLARHYIPTFLLDILILDLLKSCVSADPYFWTGNAALTSPIPHPFTRPYRTFISAAYVFFALRSIMSLSPLIFGCLLGPAVLGENAWPWLYPPTFGSLKYVLTHGLAGAWARWWHQLFRLPFEMAGDFLCLILLGNRRDRKSQAAQLIRLAAAFTLSGLMHASAAYSALGPTRPMRASCVWFMIQPLGIFAQRTLAAYCARMFKSRSVWVGQLANLVFVLGWCALTGPLIADDLARTGIWLGEPVPFSLVRGLQGYGWWRWGGAWCRLYLAPNWWMSGLAI